jgi:hypothetical protein
VEGGDHSFTVNARARRSQEQVHEEIQDDIVQWMSVRLAAPYAPYAAARTGAPRRPIASRVGTQLRSLRRSATS